MSRKQKPKTSSIAHLIEDGVVALLMGLIRIIGAVPSRWVLRVADAIAWILYVLDRRGRDIAKQNLDAVFPGELDAARRRAIVWGAYRESVRAAMLLLHLQPLDETKWRRWVDVPDDAREDPRSRQIIERGAVMVSGHIGNWELLLGMRVAFPDFPPTVFVAEVLTRGVFQRVVEHLRSYGDVIAAMRKGGARLVTNTVRNGGVAAIVADRNVRGRHGGIYAPFLGLPARTTPLPAWLAIRSNVPLFPVLCFPIENGRYRVWLGPDLTVNLEGLDANGQLVEVTRRINHVFSAVIRAQPEVWNWMLKRFKSRPTAELGGYPPYSRHDADSKARRDRSSA